MKDKVSIIGAGNVGSTLAMRVVESRLADVALIDVVGGLAEGKAMDLEDASYIIDHDCKITGGTDMSTVQGSRVVVITAGLARQPGMTRDDLLKKNAEIVKGIVVKIKQFCADCIIIVVTNPLDAMTYLAYKLSGFESNRVMGMAGILDSARLSAVINRKLSSMQNNIYSLVIGSHNDTMVPIFTKSTISGKAIPDILKKEEIDDVRRKTANRGAEIVKCLQKGSAYYAPSAGGFAMIKSILKNEKRLIPASAYLSGQYGIDGLCIGVPVILGQNGIEKVAEIDLTAEERQALSLSAKDARETVDKIKNYIT